MWLYGHISAIWPYSYMAIWHYGLPIWVSMETAIKTQQYGEEIKLIGLFCEK
jgi:hypothetical protein